jgi:hypothetical protein
MSPREQVLPRGWEVDEDREECSLKLPGMSPWADPVYGGQHELIEAVYTQLERDVRRLGGFEALTVLADVSGRELEF